MAGNSGACAMNARPDLAPVIDAPLQPVTDVRAVLAGDQTGGRSLRVIATGTAHPAVVAQPARVFRSRWLTRRRVAEGPRVHAPAAEVRRGAIVLSRALDLLLVMVAALFVGAVAGTAITVVIGLLT